MSIITAELDSFLRQVLFLSGVAVWLKGGGSIVYRSSR